MHDENEVFQIKCSTFKVGVFDQDESQMPIRTQSSCTTLYLQVYKCSSPLIRQAYFVRCVGSSSKFACEYRCYYFTM